MKISLFLRFGTRQISYLMNRTRIHNRMSHKVFHLIYGRCQTFPLLVYLHRRIVNLRKNIFSQASQYFFSIFTNLRRSSNQISPNYKGRP